MTTLQLFLKLVEQNGLFINFTCGLIILVWGFLNSLLILDFFSKIRKNFLGILLFFGKLAILGLYIYIFVLLLTTKPLWLVAINLIVIVFESLIHYVFISKEEQLELKKTLKSRSKPISKK